MCHESPAAIAPRIIALLSGESVAWTGNEILGRIASGDVPCELHFDETIRQLVRDGKLTSDSDAFAPSLTSTTRCRLAFMLAPGARTATTTVQPVPVAEKPQAPAVVPPPPPVVRETRPTLPSPAVRLEVIGRLRADRDRVVKEWFERFGADCFLNGSPEFLKTLFQQARTYGMMPRLRDAVERAQGRRIDDFDRHCENLLLLNDRDATIPDVTIDSGVKLDLMYYISLDLDRAEREVREGREGNPANARELLGFLKEVIDKPTFRRPAPATKAIEPVPKAPPADPILGLTLGPYKVVSLIGKGGMGAVYEGMDETLGRHVALKVLHSQFTDNREHQDRFLREARNAAHSKLDHPNITQVYAAGREGPHLWLAMQLVRGRTLTSILEERKSLPPEEALRIVRQVAEGLAVAHAAEMIHRDIKPDNLMIDESGRVKIMDFGLMRSVDVKKDGLTADGLFVGTVEYASPEQCQDRKLDARTDLYSLGVVLYELLSGKRPYKAKNAFAYLSTIPDPKQPPAPLPPQAPAVEELVRRMIAKNRDERYGSAQELIRAIDAALVAPAAVPRAAAKSAVASLVAWSIALAAAIGTVILFWPKPEEPAVTRRPVAPPSADQEAAQALEAFEKSLPQELVGSSAWSTWERDTRDSPGGTIVFDPARTVYVLSAPSAKEQVRLLKKLPEAARGYRLQWSLGPGTADTAAFMVALSFTRWFEAGPRGLTLFRADGDQVSTVRKIDFADRIQGGVFHVFPRPGVVLVYLNGRLILTLTGKEYALDGGLQLGMSGGSVSLESIRVTEGAR